LPFTTFLALSIATGFAAALAGSQELRISPRHALVTSSFFALLAFVGFLLLPASIYFYVFHGDWFMLYLLDVRHVPSALALIGFLLEGLLAVAGFSLGASLIRNQHTPWIIGGLSVSGLAALSVLALCPERLRSVGTYGQYRGGFGLEGYGGALMQGTAAMGLLLLAGGALLIFRIRAGVDR
jgi:hypothetical protein